ncbi:6-phospho-3-hexuloisomerase [Klebsiella pneumoniae]|nr:6-phospho-3-hexuloisomerase [Klebsiella pneumoniae]EKU7352987.1 6-phospho-3-hexuloisomerase [Klebsiella pneumoniae]EKU8105908.1 6-phospho-3-hexuloisomerase [Klebsiella pneumoniae]EKU8126800.1 6-phospho-3-hexuloisomerase [Klebsiella pneumoniae]EKU8132969.1 6-phospho-3-hexuloisomerase [Klebsiella pneumoniae]
MSHCQNLQAILAELMADAQQIDGEEVNALGEAIMQAKRVFVAGAGRSGFASRAFANRLMHLGFSTWFVGEPTTPSIQPGDLLIIGSGSGETASLVTMAQKAHKQGAKIATLTIYPEHTIGNIAETIIRIPGITAKSEHATSKAETIQPTGSSFEQLSWLIYDSVVIALKEKTAQTDAQMFSRHANLE